MLACIILLQQPKSWLSLFHWIEQRASCFFQWATHTKINSSSILHHRKANICANLNLQWSCSPSQAGQQRSTIAKMVLHLQALLYSCYFHLCYIPHTLSNFPYCFIGVVYPWNYQQSCSFPQVFQFVLLVLFHYHLPLLFRRGLVISVMLLWPVQICSMTSQLQ